SDSAIDHASSRWVCEFIDMQMDCVFFLCTRGGGCAGGRAMRTGGGQVSSGATKTRRGRLTGIPALRGSSHPLAPQNKGNASSNYRSARTHTYARVRLSAAYNVFHSQNLEGTPYRTSLAAGRTGPPWPAPPPLSYSSL
ncbi:unnamed protein product, partial [Ectocarpus sp. 13 AM-2016]